MYVSATKRCSTAKFGEMNALCLNRRTKLEKVLCFATVTTLLMLIMMTSTLAVSGYNHQSQTVEKESLFTHSNSRRFSRQVTAEDVCDTHGCAKTADDIIQSLNESVDPCDNFYKFACGGWIDKHTIRDDRSQESVFDEVGEGLNLQLKGLLEKQLNGSEPKTIKMVKDFYDSCMNIDSLENAGNVPLETVLATLGGWPVVVGEVWDESKFNWMESLFALKNLGYDHTILIATSVTVDYKNNAVHIIELDQTTLGMPDREYLLKGLNDSATQAYFNLMVKAAKKLGANEQTAEDELMQALDFEITLANYSLPNEERRDYISMYHKYNVSQLQELVPQIDWLKFLNGHLDNPITETEMVLAYVPDFLKKFGELITTTDKRIVANYMMWRVVAKSVGKLSKDWRALEHEYNSALSGESVEKPRWEQCLTSMSNNFVDKNLDVALSFYYLKHYFKGDSKQKAQDMVGYISKEFLNILENIDWMDDDTKRQAKEKANAIAPFMGYPQELLDDAIVDEYHKNLTITNENYFSNSLNLKKWATDDTFLKLRKPNIKGEWKNHANAAIVNAFYNPFENSIEIPAGILQKVFFDKDRPNYMNFGGIGYVIGHEITHGFDDMGKQFDKDGNMKEWWDKTTDDNFKEKAKCIIYQYGNYTVVENGLQVNGINTQGENIADNGGLIEAYRAYHSWVKDNGPEKKLPGLKYTPSQLFWISAANVWCGKFRPELLKLMVLSDPHSPSEFRVNGPMSNLKEFATAYECAPGTNMNPDKKCKVW